MRGVYTSGVLDVLMQHDLYFPAVAAVSAGGAERRQLPVPPAGAQRPHQPALPESTPAMPARWPCCSSRGLFGLEFIVSGLTEKEPFDADAFQRQHPAAAGGGHQRGHRPGPSLL